MSSVEDLVNFIRQVFGSALEISDEWVKSSIEADFTDFSSLSGVVHPSLFDDEDVVEKIEALANQCKEYIQKADSPDLWKRLLEEEFPPKNLPILLWFALEGGLQSGCSTIRLSSAVQAASAYLLLSSIKGAQAYEIFHTGLYNKSMDVFRKVINALLANAAEMDAEKKRKRTKGPSVGTTFFNKTGAGNRTTINKTKHQRSRNDDEDASMDEPAAKYESDDLKKMLLVSTNSLFVFLKRVSLLNYVEESQRTVDFIRDIARIDIDKTTKVNFAQNLKAFEKLTAFSDRAFALMQRYLDNGHSAGGILAYSHFVMPRLLHLTIDNSLVPSTSSIPVSMTVTKDLIVAFVKERIERDAVDEEEFRSIKMILANIVDKCADRADYRSKVTNAFVQVFCLLPRNVQQGTIQNLFFLSRLDKASCRSFIVEMLPQLLAIQELNQLFVLKVRDGNIKEEPQDEEMDMTDLGETARDDSSERSRSGEQAEDGVTKRRKPNKNGEDGEERDNPLSDDELDEADESENEREKDTHGDKKNKKKTSIIPSIDPGEFVYRTLVQYLVDKVPSVRAKALIQLETLIAKPHLRESLMKMAARMLKENSAMFLGMHKEEKRGVPKSRHGRQGGETATPGPDEEELPAEVIRNRASNDGEEEKGEISNLIFYLMSKAADDEKTLVRKAALFPIRAYFRVTNEDPELKKLLKILKNRSMDSALSVRKQAAEVINDILDTQPFFREKIVKTWLKSIMPMVCDRENGAKELSTKLIFERLCLPFQANEVDDCNWALLKQMRQEEGFRRYLVRVLDEQSKQDRVSDALVRGVERQLQAADEPDRIDSLWMLLADLCLVYNKIQAKISLSAWQTMDYSDEAVMSRAVHIVKVLSRTCDRLKPEEKEELAQQLQKLLIEFRLGIPLIKPVYVCLATLLDAVTEKGKGKGKLQQFGKDLLIACRKKLADAISFTLTLDKSAEGKIDDVTLLRVLDSIAEALQFSPALYAGCSKLLEGLQQIMSSGCLVADYQSQVVNAHIPDVDMVSSQPWQIPTAHRPSSTSGQRHDPPTSSRAAGSQINSQKNPKEGFYWSEKLNLEIPTAIGVTEKLLTQPVRSYCAVAIGKVCILDQKFAKVMVPAFVRQLQTNPDHLIRSNIVIVLGDLCVRFTSLVNRYSAIIAGCLRDRSALVKMQTLQTLTFLIKEQFLIFKGEIMYQLVAMTLDADKHIRKYASFCLTKVLMPQFPMMFRNHFIECLVYFNQIPKGFMPGSELNEEDVLLDKAAMFNLAGKRQRDNRVSLYRFMIQTFNDTMRFEIMAHLCDQVLAKLRTQINLGKMSLTDPRVNELLADIFIILSMDEIRLKMDMGKNPNAGADDEEEIIPERVEKVVKKALTEAFMRATLENVMPPLFDIKRMLYNSRSPLIRLCIYAIKSIVEQFSGELDEFFAGNEDLREEYAFDLHRYKEMGKVQKAAEERHRLEKERQRESRQTAQTQRGHSQGDDVASQVDDVAEPVQGAEVVEDPDKTQTPNEANAQNADVEMRNENTEEGRQHGQNVEKTAIEPEEAQEKLTEGNGQSQQNQDEQMDVDQESLDVTLQIPQPAAEKGKDQNEAGNGQEDEKMEEEEEVNEQREQGGQEKLNENSPDADDIDDRAISTPIKNILSSNITFMGLDLSAIQRDDPASVVRRSRPSAKIGHF
ncbi:hypothetical protein WR25_16966 [Diploscapter pachys]|uniref:Condensin complex subunit 1 C-terminal domain-containing protein n=1 Tax=Diploscapter pachys TaxID=2018661 RepID=A0A2A2KS98_9BILA|nr:hypothetical protein WR25_16966 [Diploscapter pachys]